MNMNTYLQQHFRKSTEVYYTREIKKYIATVRNAETASYTDIVNYLGALRNQQCGTSKLQGTLQAIKHYYHYLLATGIRNDHPCRDMVLKDKKNKSIQLQDLFTTEELESLMNRKERYKIMELRNKVIISLLIYQGLSYTELTVLTLKDINLTEGSMYIKRTTHTNNRTIALHSSQILLFQQYITETRPQLLARNKKDYELQTTNNALLLTWKGTVENGEGIQYLIETAKHLFPGRKLNPRTIRQSVITNLLKQGKDLRMVQVYAGHKSPDTTEKYKQSHTEKLQQMINQYHPLK